MLVTSDIHLDSDPDNVYRWEVFQQIADHIEPGEELMILGDLTDKKDRHPAELVNPLVDELRQLARDRTVTILMGNHDAPITATPYWRFLNAIKNVKFITQPTARYRELLLPHTTTPETDWADIDFGLYDVVFTHFTVGGVEVARGHHLDGPRWIWTSGIPVFSGDIHVPQRIGDMVYVGAPHHVRFGDTHPCRFLRVHDTTYKWSEIRLDAVRKSVIEITSPAQLADISMRDGDQARVRIAMTPEDADRWPAYQSAITTWAKRNGVRLASIEALVTASTGDSADTPNEVVDAEPHEVLRAFAASEKIGDRLREYGLRLLDESRR